MTIDYRVGDTRDLTAAIPDGSISLVASSPPFLALRSYLPAGHDSKHQEIGSEADPATFLDTLLGLTAEWGRVLAPWGSIAIELGDTYSGSGASGWERDSGEYRRETRSAASGRGSLQQTRTLTHWPRAKSLALIPQLYACSLAYGRNILTGAPSPAGQWLVRNVIVWHRPNPAVGALGDKYRPSTSYIVVATRSPKRWFDLTAVRGEPSPNTHARTANGVASRQTTGKAADRDGNFDTLATLHETAGAPPLDTWTDPQEDSHDTWTITTQPSRLAHYAMWPPRLAERLILSMCPLSVCSVCGEARRRVEGTASYERYGRPCEPDAANFPKLVGNDRLQARRGSSGHSIATAPTLGWTDCGHNNYIPGVVLDPFAGTATTCCVAELHHRNSIGIDLDPRNAQLVDKRMAEVKRALFGTQPEMVGQLDMFEEIG